MDIIGKWIVKKAMYPGEEGMLHLTKEEMIAHGVDEDDLEMFGSVIEFKADGTVETKVQIPADQIEAAKAEGAPVDADGCIVVDSTTWKEEGGAYLYDLGGDFAPLDETEDGLLSFGMGMMLLEKQ